MEAVRSGRSDINELQKLAQALIPFAEIINTTQTMFAALKSLRESRFVDVASVGMTKTEPIAVDDNA